MPKLRFGAIAVVAILGILITQLSHVNCSSCLEITNDGPAVDGGSITFNINYTCDQTLTQTRFNFIEEYHKMPSERFPNGSSISWTIKLDAATPQPGTYRFRAEIYQKILFFYAFLDSHEILFDVKPFLSLSLERKSNDHNSQQFSHDQFVPLNVSFNNRIRIQSEADRRLISSSARIFWFRDCLQLANTSDFANNQTYSQLDHNYKMDAIVAVQRPANMPAIPTPNITVCDSKQFVTNDSYAYGHLSWSAIAKNPIENISLIGNSWLLQGNPLELHFYCNGSAEFRYCVHYFGSVQNHSFDNVTCFFRQRSDTCSIPITWYYYFPGKFTVLVLVENVVSAIKYNITVNVYEITKQTQLSVIIVPMFFILISLIMVIFGIAYFLQKRRESIIEEANFDFAQRDLNYQSFCERLAAELEVALPHSLKKLVVRWRGQTGGGTVSETTSVTASAHLATSEIDSLHNLIITD